MKVQCPKSRQSLPSILPISGTFNPSNTTKSPIGALDLGGASAQKTNTCFNEDCNNLRELYLFGENYLVTTSSALCYGLEEAMKRFIASLIYDSYLTHNKTLQNSITNPCLPQDFVSSTGEANNLVSKQRNHISR